jgi:predicted amidophosphoribosyltransferase
MPLKVVCFCAYLTDITVPWRDDDHNANKFVKSFKGEPIKGYAKIQVGKTWHRLSESNRDQAVDWFGEMAAEYIKRKHKTRPLAFAPLPSSKCIAGGKVVSPTYRIAEAIASRLQDVTIWDGLRWTEEMTPSHKGGVRDPDYFYKRLAITKKVPQAEIVIVDDVLTSGAHMRAVAAKIAKKAGKCRLAICVGRTVSEQVRAPMDIIEEELEDFQP